MGHQTKISERNGSSEIAPKALARDMGEFAYDMFTLAELQVKLFIVDVQECGQRALVPGLFLICGATVGIACFPIALAALALLLVQIFELSYVAGFLVAAVVGFCLSATLCVIGWFQVRRCMAVLRRSQQELVRNLRWVKQVLERSRITRKNSIDNSWRTVK